jgi:NAD(P)-dependent dehydrogenase (short-subunit alcohol dehydrogenase family)
MTYTLDSIPDLTGTTSVVTGANVGLGLATAAALAAKGSHVIMAARNQEKAAAAAEQIRRTSPAASLVIVNLDLGSLESVRNAADQVRTSHERVDILVNNAGLMAVPEGTTADGFETQFGVNHLGHWALTALLMPALLAAPKARVVTVTSVAHHIGSAVDPANPYLHGAYRPWKAYGQSKLANYHYALGLQREFDRARVSAMSLLAHPGLSHTNLFVNTVDQGAVGFSGSFLMKFVAWTGMEPARGAMPQIRAATDPTAKGGDFYAPRFVNTGAAVKRPFLRPGADKAIASLWRVSERETGIPLTV